MKDLLIVGCSFVQTLKDINCLRVDKFGSPAASNASIASRTFYQLAQQEYKKVIVLWSGINRLSIPLGIELHNLYQLDNKPYMFYDVQDPIVWYHSGGILHTEWHSTIPKLVKDYFRTQYKTISPRYLTDQTLLNIISVQSLLKSKNINYEMNFIYDIHKDYSDSNAGYSLGTVDTSSPLYGLVEWNKINQHVGLYEWAKQTGHLDQDQFHVTSSGMIKWFNINLGIDLLY